MDHQAIRNLIKDWGYFLYPKHHAASPGHSGLLVAIRREPTGRHFDTERLHLMVRDSDGESAGNTVSWLKPDPLSDRHCLGPIILYDRFGKAVEFFSFGGTLETLSAPGERFYALRSLAPILELTPDREDVPDQLAAEVESLVARVRAVWGDDEAGLPRLLGELDPVQAYCASIHSLLDRIKCPAIEASYLGLEAALTHEQAWLMETGLWPAAPEPLEQMLAPG